MKLTDEEVANARVNVALLLVDVVDGLLLDAEKTLENHGKALSYSHKVNWRKLRAIFRKFREYVKICSRPIYEHEDVDDCVRDSDDWRDIIELIMDRIGENRRNELIHFLRQYESLYGITDK